MTSQAGIIRRLRRTPDADAARLVVRDLSIAELEEIACWAAERWRIGPVNGCSHPRTGSEPPGTGCGPDAHENGRELPDPVIVLSTNLRHRRHDLLMTQEQVSHGAGVGMSYYSRLERGEVDPGTRSLTRIARALGTTPAVLMENVK